MRKDSLKSIIKEVKKSGETSRAYFVPTLQEIDYLVSKGIQTNKKTSVTSGLNGSWSSDYFEFKSL